MKKYLITLVLIILFGLLIYSQLSNKQGIVYEGEIKIKNKIENEY